MMRARHRSNPLIVAREHDFRQGAALDPSNGRGLGAYAEFLYYVVSARGRQERSEARLVGRSDVAQVRVSQMRCSVSTIAAPRTRSKKHCRCWSSIRTSFRRCLCYGTFRWLIGRQAGRSRPDCRACHRARSEQSSAASHRRVDVSRSGRCEGGARCRRRHAHAAKRARDGAALDARGRLATCGTRGIRRGGLDERRRLLPKLDGRAMRFATMR